MSKKVIVKVLAEFSPDGQLVPLQITWPDGRVFLIDRVLDVRQAADIKGGGTGIRYLCRIQGREVPIFYGQNSNGRADVWWCCGE